MKLLRVLIAHYPTPCIKAGTKNDDGTWTDSVWGDTPPPVVVYEHCWTEFIVDQLSSVEHFEFGEMYEGADDE